MCKAIKKKYDCIEYLSVVAPLEKVEYLENKQSKYIHEYVKNKEYRIVGDIRRNGLSQKHVYKQWQEIVYLIRKKLVDGVVISNLAAIAPNLPMAFMMIGKIIEAGGIIVTVDDGRLELDIGGFKND